MKTGSLPTKDKCMGCMACVNVCKKGAVYVKKDKLGFAYATINSTVCVKCGRCRKVCPSINFNQNVKCHKNPDQGYFETHDDRTCKQPIVYAVISKNRKQRFQSTSGGVFPILARKVIEHGGYVVGAAYGKNFKVKHILVDTLEGVERLKQSKYVQSDTREIYIKVEKALKSGREVLFSGTPCQIDALNCYLGKMYDNLIISDIICIGVPSPYVYRDYLLSLSQRYHSSIQKVWFKYKGKGWDRLSTRVDFDNGKIYEKDKDNDLFMKGFRKYNLFVREACYSCPYKGFDRKGDITLGDFWGLNSTKFEDNKGISLVLINTKSGKKIFREIEDDIRYETRTIEEASRNEGLVMNIKKTREAKLFYKLYPRISLRISMKIIDIMWATDNLCNKIMKVIKSEGKL